jgi:multiple sugar transport system ATP-binding protein
LEPARHRLSLFGGSRRIAVVPSRPAPIVDFGARVPRRATIAEIKLQNVTKIYPDGTQAVSSVDLDVDDGQLMVLVGPSGCGKTTILRMVAGLEDITDGVVRIGERVVNDVQPKDRDIAMVFQNYALYPHMSVHENMALALKLRKVPKDEIERRVSEAAVILGLADLLARRPRQLSGGQRQRVAMGRAIVREPEVFLMDEPLSNLDAKLRVQMRAEISRIQRRVGTTTIYVTHDQTEAMTLGDVVVVMRDGRVQQAASPHDLYEHPANLFVAGFIGSPAMNMAEAIVDETNGDLSVVLGRSRLRIASETVAARPALRAYVGRPVVVGIRPEDIEDASLAKDAPADRRFEALVELREDMGSEILVHFHVDAQRVLTADAREMAIEDTDPSSDIDARASTTFIARISNRSHARLGEPIELAVDTSALHFFDLETGRGVYSEVPAEM